MIGIKKALDMLSQFDVLVDCSGDYKVSCRLIEYIRDNKHDPNTAKYLSNFNDSDYLFQGFYKRVLLPDNHRGI